ncbi:MAG: hypothetical protein KBG48_17930 [Kofleriaceae bacterium]|jgi:hypothetical protein|nr:hypothetical protein [Kofleriaceae bacterium]MBP9169283.1 hypothetical protein [Kofleriaceae bacterium]MBP9859008.1 hypothetical protein [Kofleriaceae bacterium]
MSLASDAAPVGAPATRPSTPDRSTNPFLVYVGRIREFDRTDWQVYIVWIGMMLGLVFSTAGFLAFGHAHGVRFPVEAWLVPIGAAIFSVAIAIDTIGHRTIYKEALKGGEALIHQITIVNGVASCVLLVLAYAHRGAVIPAMVTTGLSFMFSVFDEGFHWKRYTSSQADPVEMWSHVGIFLGHGIMMVGWWWFWALGYPGVAATLGAL